MQWMNLHLLINAPQADSLVYMTEAYNDYWLIRNWDWLGLFHKYVTAGNQISSPLLWGLTAIYFLFFGLDPQGAYTVVAIFYLFWVCGIVYLAWNLYPDEQYALSCGFLAALLPSAAAFGLRNYMLDFVAAAPFIWSTAFLIKSDLFHKRKDVIIYSLLVGVTILFRTTAIVYFIPHIAILTFQCILKKRWPSFQNIGISILICTLSIGWFLAPNFKRILSYYGYWATQANQIPQANPFLNNLFFYFDLLQSWHFLNPGFILLCTLTLLGAVIFFVKAKYLHWNFRQYLQVLQPFVIIIMLVFIPTASLSLYSSRAPSVDFLFIGGYLLLPFLFWKTILPKSKYYWIPVSILLIAFGATQLKILIKSNGIQDYREREVLRMILSDADLRGLHTISLGNTGIHQHNSLSYQYWTLANYFPKWTGRVNLASIGRTNSADDLAKMNKNADYVVMLENYNNANWHPNNVVAPEANKILQDLYGMKTLPGYYDLPDGTTVKILVRPISINYPAPMADGWYENKTPIRIEHTNKSAMDLRITAELMNIDPGHNDINISLKSNSEPSKVITFKSANNRIDYVFSIPANFFSKNSYTDFELISSGAGSVKINGVIKDKRNLAFRNLSIKEVYPN